MVATSLRTSPFLATWSRRIAAAALVATLCVSSFAQDAGDSPPPAEPPKPTDAPNPGLRAGPDMGREQMWKAPTAEDWKKPVLITFQRTWDDAVAVAQETGRPILICVNMDGEIASEHYAGVRYRQPDVAAYYEPYVCVIASVYRHNPRDYDDEGRRILCPRFGSVTCGEHIDIEPFLFEKFFDGQRVAPRHIMVEPDGEKEVYDVFYANDTASVFDQLREGVKDRPSNAPIVRGDRPITERVASRDIADRTAVEDAYRSGDAAARKALLDKALETPGTAPVDLLRLALFGLDVDSAQKAQQALAQTETPAAAELISEALRVPMDAATRESLIAALERLGAKSRRAEWLAGVHRGLASKSTPVDPEAWAKALAGAKSAAPVTYERNALQRDRSARAAVAKAKPDDAQAHLDLALVTLDLALRGVRENAANAKEEDAFRKLLLHDARTAANEAETLGAEDWRTSAVLALATYYDGRPAESYARAEQAVKEMPEGEPSWNASAVLTIFAESRFKAIQQAIHDKEKWSPEWLADLHAAYTVLLKHPLGTVDQVVWYYDFLDWLRARHRAEQYLTAGLERFDGSSELHKRLRELVIRTRGVDALEESYAAMMAKEPHHVDLPWFAGYASLVAAETHRRKGELEPAQAAYGRAITLYEQATQASPASRASVDHNVALALAGRARVEYMNGDDDAALADVLASFERAPASAGTRDGIGVTPGETGQMLLARLVEQERKDEAARLQKSLDGLDPELLKPDRP